MEKRPLILITNDDGITSKGIRVLIEIASKLGEVVVVAPNSPQSGMGHAITISDPLRLYKSEIFEGIEAYECSGTPVDCVKIAKKEVLKTRQIDLVLSGINHGSNTSISVIYSGTMSAAIEAAIEGLPTIGFSLCDYGHDADFMHIKEYIKQIVSETLIKGLPKHVALNVNFPSINKGKIKGLKICRQANAKWVEEYQKRMDPNGRSYYWASGELVTNDTGVDTDEWAIANNYVSIVPCQFDMTAHHAVTMLNSEWTIII
jgi:5'-nucleotidase